jgi:catechol 2,3-dioxygenase-like lactoylglutathione lyase family enzyme
MTTGINHITFAVTDLPRSLSFYAEIIGCRKVAVWNSGAYLQAGDAWLCLSHDRAAVDAAGRDYTHVAFSFDAVGLAAFRARLAAADGREWQADSSEGDSIYFLDPDGHRLEAHVGNLSSRMASLHDAPYEGLVVFKHDEP